MTPPRSSQICRSKKPPPGDTKEGPKPYSLNDIHLFMLGTAGMRDLGRTDRVKQSDLERTINTYLEGTPYKKEDPPYKTITGEEEAAFGWISANFLLGTFSELGQTSSSQTRGYLEMGGASAQIAFRPHANELAPWDLQHGDITRVQLGGVDFNLFLRTYDLGSNTAWREYQLDLIQDATRDGEDFHPDPDSPYGREWTYTNQLGTSKLRGTGKFNAANFTRKVSKVLDRLAPPVNPRGSRLLDENLILTLKARRFVGGANFWYSTHEVFGRDSKGNPKNAVFRFEDYEREVQRTTMLSWSTLQDRLNHRNDDIAGKAWFVAEWVKCVLVEGFGFQFTDQSVKTEDELSFRPYNGPAGAHLTWTLGKMVHFVTGNVGIQTKLSLQVIMKNYQKDLVEKMRAKANQWEDIAWDYKCMSESLREVTGRIDNEGERLQRLLGFLETATATASQLQKVANEMDEEKKKSEEDRFDFLDYTYQAACALAMVVISLREGRSGRDLKSPEEDKMIKAIERLNEVNKKPEVYVWLNKLKSSLVKEVEDREVGEPKK